MEQPRVIKEGAHIEPAGIEDVAAAVELGKSSNFSPKSMKDSQQHKKARPIGEDPILVG